MSLGREQFTLVCAECGKGHSGSMAWLQSQRVMVCTRCGAELLASVGMPMPDAVRTHEPVRLAFVTATRLIRQPSSTPESHTTWLSNIAASTTEAAEVAQHLHELATVMTASGLPDAVPGGDRVLSEALEAVAGDLADRMEQRPPDLGAAAQEADGSEAANGADGATRRAPKREPRDTPDLR